MNAAYPVICCDDLAATKAFYVTLFGFRPVFEADFYVHLAGADGVQLGFVRADHSSVPDGFGGPAAGVFVTIETDEVDAVHDRARELGLDVVQPLQDEAWGQRHFMVRDPNDLLVDVVRHIPPADEYCESFRAEAVGP